VVGAVGQSAADGARAAWNTACFLVSEYLPRFFAAHYCSERAAIKDEGLPELVGT
jgi:hypothetical protein